MPSVISVVITPANSKLKVHSCTGVTDETDHCHSRVGIAHRHPFLTACARLWDNHRDHRGCSPQRDSGSREIPAASGLTGVTDAEHHEPCAGLDRIPDILDGSLDVARSCRGGPTAECHPDLLRQPWLRRHRAVWIEGSPNPASEQNGGRGAKVHSLLRHCRRLYAISCISDDGLLRTTRGDAL